LIYLQINAESNEEVSNLIIESFRSLQFFCIGYLKTIGERKN